MNMLKCLGCGRIQLTSLSQAFIRCSSTLTPGPTAPIKLMSVHEPKELDMKPEIEEYDVLNISLKSHDFSVLEAYSAYVRNLTRKHFGLETKHYTVPGRSWKIMTYKPNTTAVLHEYDLTKYQRNVQVYNVPSPMLPLLIEVLQMNLPEGMSLGVAEPSPDEEEFRYVPDLMVRELQSQMSELEKAMEDRRKK